MVDGLHHPADPERGRAGRHAPGARQPGSPLRDTFTRLGNTVRDAARYREMFKMLLAFWFYMEGIGAIILLATSYGAALGLDTSVLIATLLMTQFVAFPYALMFGRIPVADQPLARAFHFHAALDGGDLPADGPVCQPERAAMTRSASRSPLR